MSFGGRVCFRPSILTDGEAVLLGEGQTVIVTITRIDPRREEPWVFEFTTGDQR